MLPPGTYTPPMLKPPQESTVNADPGELAKFSAAAHTWWDLDGEFKPLHRINPLRLNWISQWVHWPDTQVLDVGCGGGILSDAMARKGARVTGADLSTKALAVARLHALEAQSPPVDYREISAEALAQQLPAHFDVVTCMEMLEHVPDPASIVRACAALVKPGGWVFFSTLSRTPTTFFTAILAAEYLLKIVPKGTHEYEKLIRPSELAGFIRQSGLQVQRSIGLHYNPLSDRFWLAYGPSANYMIAAQRPTL